MTHPKLIAIVGETATGKSGLAMDIARRFDGEIINADSWQIYRGMDIGTAKPPEQDRQAIPHHLIDIVEPDADFTAAEYKQLALAAIEEVASRGKLPVMVGGTGLYVDSVLFDYSFTPEGTPGQRQALNQKTIPQLLEMIKDQNIDLVGIDTRNKRRLIRLLETGGVRPSKSDLRSETLVIGLRTKSRADLRENIERRVEVMFRKGLKHEVRELAEKYDWDKEAMKGIGYKEFRDYFEGTQFMAETRRKIVKNTLELAKRQRTWFKRNRQIQWLNDYKQAKALVNDFLNK